LVTKKIRINVPEHLYIPKHEILKKKEVEELLKKFNTKPSEIPLIFETDPAIVGLGVKPGDMIKVTRKSPTAGKSIFYRYVVEE